MIILTHSDVCRLIDRDLVLQAVERAHREHGLGIAQVPGPPAMTVGGTSLVPMVAAGSTLAAVKMLADVPRNAARGLPVQRSSIMVTDVATGECRALVDGRQVTAVRTAATSAVATRYLARPGSSVLGLVGAGTLAVEHTRAIAAVHGIDTVVVWSRSTATVERYRAAVEDLRLVVKPADSVEEVVRAADVLCTLTPSRNPIVRGAWFAPGLHVNAVGAPPRPDHREVDGEGLARARVVVDSVPTAMAKSGEVVLALAEGTVTSADVETELGRVVAGLAPGRSSDEEITLFDSVGLGLQDLATAELLLEAAAAQGVGTEIDLSR
ncbi:ornithine cyclodeaminase family protein [Pseudonocardia xishanensis]|uniref:Alanine dehydrogenase n=1 Tax=Pseudonocardia xishanensis TaxID=630995 RepID=A0ABP8S1T4_9PSEU